MPGNNFLQIGVFRRRQHDLIVPKLLILALAQSAVALTISSRLELTQLALLLQQALGRVKGLGGPADLEEVLKAAHERGHVVARPVAVQIVDLSALSELCIHPKIIFVKISKCLLNHKYDCP